MSPRPSSARAARDAQLIALALAACIAGAFAPAQLTGTPSIDVLERMALTGAVTFVGAHGRRWSWIVGAALVVAPARGASLVIALVGMVVLVVACTRPTRSKALGGLGLAFVVNAPFWYGSSSYAAAPLAATAAFVLLVVAGNRYQRRSRRRSTTYALAATGALVVLGGLLLGVAVLRAGGRVSDGSASARDALEAARDGKPEVAQELLAEASADFAAARSSVDGPFSLPTRLVPVLAQQRRAISVAVHEGLQVSRAGDDLVATADYDRLRYDGRIDLDQVHALAAPTQRADGVLDEATANLRHTGGQWLLPPLDDRVDELTDELQEAADAADLAADLFQVTPDLLGRTRSRRYLVLFTTPAELRGAGGFIGSYAELTADQGRLRLTRSGPIRDLIDGAAPGARTITGFDDYRARYGSFQPADFLQDVTYSPDFPTDAGVMAQLYPQSGGAELDGVIGVDPAGLAALLELTGPVEVPGLAEDLTADNAVDVLLRDQYVDLPEDSVRNEVLAQATKRTFEELTETKLPGPKQLADVLSPAARAGHLRLWSPVAREQALFERLGADGALRIDAGADGFAVVQQNLGNNKLDAYLQRTITYAAKVDATNGEVRSTLTIDLRNDAPPLDLPDAVVGNSRGAPRGTNLASLSVFTPNVVTAAVVDGRAVVLAPSTELGLNAWDLPLVRIPPGGTVRVVLTMEGAVDLGDGYRLEVLPQPVANPDRFAATLEVARGSVRSDGDGDDGSGEVTLLDEPLQAPTRREVDVTR